MSSSWKSRNGWLVLSLIAVALACGGNDKDEDSNADAGMPPNGGDMSVACALNQVNQCFEWINLPATQVPSLEDTCVNDDDGVVVDSCPTEDLIGICEELDSLGPDLLNHFYMSPSNSDPEAYIAAKAQSCMDAGGVWKPV